MWPSNKEIPLFVGVPVIMTHRVVKPSVRNNIFCDEIRAAITTFFGAPNPKDVCPTQIDNDHRKKNKMAPVNRK